MINKLLNSTAATAVAMLTKIPSLFHAVFETYEWQKIASHSSLFHQLDCKTFFFVFIKLLPSHSLALKTAKVQSVKCLSIFHVSVVAVFCWWKITFYDVNGMRKFFQHLNMKVLIVLTIYVNHCYFVCTHCNVKAF